LGFCHRDQFQIRYVAGVHDLFRIDAPPGFKVRGEVPSTSNRIHGGGGEAGHRSIFVAGWRPFIGWVCGFAHVTAIPKLTGTETLVTVLLSLLGLGAMRTAEKFGGKAR
jgi:hypothetical protein